MSKCEKCKHKGICKHEENMQKFQKEITEKKKLMEYQTFRVEINCENYLDDKTLVFPQGTRNLEGKQ